jgi:hypothetical protein
VAKPKLKDKDFCRSAARLRCEVAAIKAVAQVESKRDAFDEHGFPTILFERHKFYKYAKNRKALAKTHPDICNAKPGGYGKYAEQKPKFDRAFALDQEAAMMACSWGMFQVMGFNWKDLGYESVGEFVNQMKSGEPAQLEAFVRYVEANHLADELRSHDWNTFALRYNGEDYRKNNYHIKLPAAYKEFKKQDIDCTKVLADDPPVSDRETEESANEDAGSVVSETQESPTQIAENIVNTGDRTVPDNFVPEQKMIAAPEKEGTVQTSTTMTIAGITVPAILVAAIKSIQDLVTNGYINAKDVGDQVVNLIVNNLRYFAMLIGLIIVLLMLRKAFKQVTLWLQMWIISDPNRHDVEVQKQ